MCIPLSFRHDGGISLPYIYGYDPSTLGDLGVSHGDDLFVQFGVSKTKEDARMGAKLARMWTDFAKGAKMISKVSCKARNLSL